MFSRVVFYIARYFHEIFYIFRILIFVVKLQFTVDSSFCDTSASAHSTRIQTNGERKRAKFNFQCLGELFPFLPLIVLQISLSTCMYNIHEFVFCFSHHTGDWFSITSANLILIILLCY